MVGGTGVVLAEGSVVRDAELFVAVDVDAGPQRQRSEARVRLASAVQREWLADLYRDALSEQREFVFDEKHGRVVERTQERYGDLILNERVSTAVDRQRGGELLASLARRAPDKVVPPSPAERSLLNRMRFLRQWMPELELPADAEALRAEAIAMLCPGCSSVAEVGSRDVLAQFRRLLTGAQRRALDQQAPTEFELPSGRRVAIAYELERPPSVAARIQELFGLRTMPRLAGGRVALRIEILAPSQRPVQITDDLESFWRRTYPEVRKQLRRRYPKHAWPEDPLTATTALRASRRR